MPAWIYCWRSNLSINRDIFSKRVSNHRITITDWALLPSAVSPDFSHQLRDQEPSCRYFFCLISCPATVLQPHLQGTTTSVHHWSSRFLRQKLQDSMANQGNPTKYTQDDPSFVMYEVDFYNQFLWISCWSQVRESYPEKLLDKSV